MNFQEGEGIIVFLVISILNNYYKWVLFIHDNKCFTFLTLCDMCNASFLSTFEYGPSKG